MTLVTLARSSSGNSPDWIIFVGIFVVIIAVGILVWWADKSRRKAIVALLSSMGFQAKEKEPKFDPVEYDAILGNPLLLYARNKVNWSAIGQYNDKVVRLTEYQFTTGGGKSQQTHIHFIASTDLPVELPEFTLERKRWLMSHRPKLKGEPLNVGNQALADAFTCYATDPTGVTTLITPPVCAIIAPWDKKRWLRFSRGTLLIGLRKKASIADIRPLLDELDRTMNAILEGAGAST